MNLITRYKTLCLAATVIVFLPRPSDEAALQTIPLVQRDEDIREDAPIGQVVTIVHDGDADGPAKITSIVYRGSGQTFYARPEPGSAGSWNIILNRTLDYETEKLLDPVFQATGGQDVTPTEFRFTLLIKDVNDNAPTFGNLPYYTEVDENTAKDTVIYTNITADDVDTGEGGKFSFQLEDSSAQRISEFVIDPITGHVTLNGALDYESTIFYHCKVVAKDNGTVSLSSTTDMFITVKDVQDSPPAFTNLPYVASVPENTRVGTSVLVVTALDQDRTIPDDVVYNITDCE